MTIPIRPTLAWLAFNYRLHGVNLSALFSRQLHSDRSITSAEMQFASTIASAHEARGRGIAITYRIDFAA